MLVTTKSIRKCLLHHLKGLALINGTQMITSLGSEAVERASAIARQADIVAALTLEVLKGTTKAFDTGQHGSAVCLLFIQPELSGGWDGMVRLFGCGSGGLDGGKKTTI